MMTTLSLKIKITGPDVLGKIELPPSSVKPKTPNNFVESLRGKVDSGWAFTFGQLIRNYKKQKNDTERNSGTHKG